MSIRPSMSEGHEAAREAVQKNLGQIQDPERLFVLLAETFQAMGDGSRVRIIWALSHGELSVGSLAEVLKMSQPAVSHHLRTLRNLKLVRTRREGRTLFYALDDEHINHLLQEGIEHVDEFL